MGSETSCSGKTGRRSVARGVRAAAFVVFLALLVAAPALAAVTSTSTGDFAPTADSGNNHWNNSNQPVSIMVLPSANTTATANFSSDGGTTWSSQTGTATGTVMFSFLVVTEGANLVKYSASDSGGSFEPTTSPGYINIDKTKPVTATLGLASVNTQTSGANWSSDTTRTVGLTASDAGPRVGLATSGVRSIVRRVNAGSFETSATPVTFVLRKGIGGVTEGSNAVTYSAVDWAGNVETTATGYVNIDTVAPTTTVSPALPTTTSSGWVNTPSVLVTLNWTDVSSGVPVGGTAYRVNDGNPTLYVNPFPVSGEGSTKLTYFSTDRAANVEATRTAYVNIDTGAPTVSASTSPSRSSAWYNQDVLVSINGVDSVSGIGGTQYRLQGAPAWIAAVNNQFTVPAADNATETFDYQAVDKAGNQSAVGNLQLNMDSAKPQAYGKNASGKVNKSITLKYKLTDNLSPKATDVYVKITKSNGDVVKTQKFDSEKKLDTWYEFTWKPTKKGTYKYYVHGSDYATNTSKTTACTITVK